MNLTILCLVTHLCSIIFPLHVCFNLFSALRKKVERGVRTKELWRKAITKAAAAAVNSDVGPGSRPKSREGRAEWDPDLCVQLIKIPAAHNYTTVRKMIEKAHRKWILEFLECDGLGVLLESLEKLGSRGFSSLADTFSQLQCVGCLRAVMNSECGLEFIIKRRDYTRQLAGGKPNNENVVPRRVIYRVMVWFPLSNSYLATQIRIPHSLSLPYECLISNLQFFLNAFFRRACVVLQSRDRVVKMQVFELLCALSMYSAKGHALVLDALNHFKMCHGRRYRFDLIVEELRSADTAAYQTTLMAFINCLIFGYGELKQRTRLRNEFFGVGLGLVMNELWKCENQELQIQMMAFERQQRLDEEESEPLTHQHLFDIVFKKVAKSPQALYFHAVLLNLSQINNSNTDVDRMWELLEEITSKAVEPIKLDKGTYSSRKMYMRSVATQTVGTSKRRNYLHLRRNCIAKCSTEVDDKKYCSVSTQSDKRCHCNTDCLSVGVQTDIGGSASLLPINLVSSSESSETLVTSSESSVSTDVSSVSSYTSLTITDSSVSSHRLKDVISYDISSSFSETDIAVLKNHLTCSFVPPPPPLPDFIDVSARPLVSSCSVVGKNDPLKMSRPPSLTDIKSLRIPVPPPLPPPPPPLPMLLPSLNPPVLTVPQNEIPKQLSPLPPPPLPSDTNDNATNAAADNISQSCNGCMTLPIKRNAPLDFIQMENKYHTLPHPNIKMKTLNWTKVSSKFLDRSFWSKTEIPSLPVDYRKLEEWFCQKPKEKAGLSETKLLKLTCSSKTIVPAVNLLDNKRSLAVNIFLKQFKSGSDFIINAINAGAGVPVEKLKALKRLLPDKTELAAIKAHKPEDGPLGTAEKFFLNLSEIKNFELRVEAMLQKEECPASINEISPLLDKILDECNFLVQDASLKQFLKVVLHLGNYLNAGSYAGNAVGFKLNTLPKLLETRANKPRVTFLHFVVEVVQDYDSNMLNFRKNFHQLRELSRTPLSCIEDEVKVLSNSVKDLKKRFKSAANEDIFNQFKDFINFAETNIAQLTIKIAKVKEASLQVGAHFCEDLSTFQLDECFALFADFFEKLGNVIEENDHRRKQEELSAKRTPDRKFKTLSKKKKSRLNDEKDCVVDLLMKEIRGGTFKLRKTVKNNDKIM